MCDSYGTECACSDRDLRQHEHRLEALEEDVRDLWNIVRVMQVYLERDDREQFS